VLDLTVVSSSRRSLERSTVICVGMVSGVKAKS